MSSEATTTSPADASSSPAPAAAPASDVVVLADGKVTKKILKAGNGVDRPPNGAEVTVHYTGRLLDGTKFDSSVDRDDPFKFKLGAGQVIKGWDVGVASMSKGEKCVLTIVSEYAYGKNGSPPKIPANATLEFEVELLDFELYQKVTEDGQIRKRILSHASTDNYLRPNDFASVTVTYTAKVKDASEPYETKANHTFVLGKDLTIIVGLEEAIKNMYKGEHSHFIVAAGYAFGEKGDAKLKIPPFATIDIDIELHDFQKAKETWDMSNLEKVDLLVQYKEQGNWFFKQGDNDKAAAKWQKAIKTVQYDADWTDDEKSKKNAVVVTCHSNLATLWAKLNDWAKVLTDTDEALKIQPKHVKCLYRQGQALARTDKLDDAERVLSDAKSVDASNAEIEKELNLVKAKKRAIVEREKKTFGGWFNKISLVSDDELAAQKKRDAAQKARDTKSGAGGAGDDDMSGDDEEDVAPADDGHGHAHGGDDHGHSHAHGDDHGHSHAHGDDHGHSHAHGDDHGHSHAHGGDDHGHSHAHGGDDDGHSHA